MAKLIDMLTTALAPLDAEVREASKKWAVERVLAIREFKKTSTGHGSHKWYADVFSIAGGYNIQCLHLRVLVTVR